MRDKYDLYRPQIKIQDVFRKSPESSYYSSPDINLSPYTTVGSLAEPYQNDKNATKHTRSDVNATATRTTPIHRRIPVVAASGPNHAVPHQDVSHTVQPSRQKYSLTKGVYSAFNAQLFTLSRVTASVMGAVGVLALFFALQFGSGESQTTATNQSDERTGTFAVSTSNGEASDSSSDSSTRTDTSVSGGDTASSSYTSGSDQSSSATQTDQNIVAAPQSAMPSTEAGGRGAGETDTASPGTSTSPAPQEPNNPAPADTVPAEDNDNPLISIPNPLPILPVPDIELL